MKNGGHMAEDNLTGDANQSAETPNDAYKSLQRKLEASRSRERQYQKEAGSAQRMEAQLSAFAVGMEQILDVIHSNGLIDDEDKFQRAKAGFSTRNSNSDAALDEIMEQLHEAETMWDDQRLSGPREAWQKGDYQGAVTQVRQILTPESGLPQTEGQIEDEVNRRIAARGGAQGVDGGGSTASSDASIINDPVALNRVLRGPNGRQYWKDHGDEIKDRVAKGEIALP
jgi:hypothetical protein